MSRGTGSEFLCHGCKSAAPSHPYIGRCSLGGICRAVARTLTFIYNSVIRNFYAFEKWTGVSVRVTARLRVASKVPWEVMYHRRLRDRSGRSWRFADHNPPHLPTRETAGPEGVGFHIQVVSLRINLSVEGVVWATDDIRD